MTASQLKFYHELHHPNSYFFTRETMRCWGDKMSNFGCINTKLNDIDVYCLYRKKMISAQHKYLMDSHYYFDAQTFRRIHGGLK